MKKNKLLIVSLIGALLAGGLVLAGCYEQEICPGRCRMDGETWLGCDALNYSCADYGECVAWEDWSKDRPVRTCTCTLPDR